MCYYTKPLRLHGKGGNSAMCDVLLVYDNITHTAAALFENNSEENFIFLSTVLFFKIWKKKDDGIGRNVPKRLSKP